MKSNILSVLIFCAGLVAVGFDQSQAAFASINCEAPPEKIYLLRHGEKTDTLYDAVLSEAGIKRARALVQAIGQEDIAAIYVTQLQRTQMTARPLARYKQLSMITVNDDSVHQLMHMMCTRHKNTIIVSVGHSYTIPTILEELGLMRIKPDYGDIFIITFNTNGAVKLEKQRFGD